MILRVALGFEYESKCLLAEHRLASGITLAAAADFLSRLVAIAEPVRSHFSWRPQLRDPGDELVLEAAANGRADAIVTFNERGLREAQTKFGIAAIAPGEALRRIHDDH